MQDVATDDAFTGKIGEATVREDAKDNSGTACIILNLDAGGKNERNCSS